jgi:glyoxylase-like metal-dependent hydrolase (beta-lactamase superfamily II)
MEKRIIECLAVGSLATNCWIYSLPEEAEKGLKPCAVIDPGDEAPYIISVLQNLNLRPEYILLTHGHFDHITGLPGLAAAFPDAKIAIHKDDAYRVPQARLILQEGDIMGPFKVLHLPGHTEGCVGYYDEETNVLFSGDTLFCGDYGRTDLPGGDFNKLVQSLKRLFAMNPKISVCPGHGPGTVIGTEANRGMI